MGQRGVLVEFIAVEMEVFFHAGDIGVVDVLLVEVFDHCLSLVWILRGGYGKERTLGNTPKRQQKHIQSPDKSLFLRGAGIVRVSLRVMSVEYTFKRCHFFLQVFRTVEETVRRSSIHISSQTGCITIGIPPANNRLYHGYQNAISLSGVTVTS